MVKKYRKKPIVIEALHFNSASIQIANEIEKFVGKELGFNYWLTDGEMECIIPTLEGEMTASLGDYIIKGVSGEFYPCKPDIFNKTYEPV